MARWLHDRATLAAIGVGGVLGATLRWLITRSDQADIDGGWFNYAPNRSFTVGTNIDGFTPVQSGEGIPLGGGMPVDTLAANLIGCLILGGLTWLLTRPSARYRRALIAAATGFCGSLTTFSAFAVEVAAMLRAAPLRPVELAGAGIGFERDLPALFLYLALSLAGGAFAFWLGRLIAKRIVDTPGVSTIGEAT